MSDKPTEAVSICVIGASGDLARKKIIPALFALYCQDLLPAEFNIFGYARSSLTDAEFREKLMLHLTCRYTPDDQSCRARMDSFINRCFYVQGHYDSRDSFLDLFSRMQEIECDHRMNRLYYLAIPPSVFLDVAHALGGAGLVHCGMSTPWSRVVIEKPFGHDRQSSDELVRDMGMVFREAQTFRIDHYLGKEVIQNLMVMRFANLVFEPLWSNQYIESVQISWKEDLSVEGRAGYFDQFGIIRDVMQNHLLQILALTAMEPFEKLDAGYICNEKIKVLRCIKPLTLDQLAIGQYTAGERNGRPVKGYLEEPDVPKESVTPTYATALMYIDNERWAGVPFCMTAGKGLDSRKTEIRVRFKRVATTLFEEVIGDSCPNELIIRVQPDEGMVLRIRNKVPGSPMRVKTSDLDLQYHRVFDEMIPDAYESLLLDVLRGDKSLFIRKDELAAAWDIFTPVLHELEAKQIKPEGYEFGSRATAGAMALAERAGIDLEEDKCS